MNEKLSTAVHSYGDARFSSILRYFGRGSPRKMHTSRKTGHDKSKFLIMRQAKNNAFFQSAFFKYNIKK